MHTERSSDAIVCVDFLMGMIHSGALIAKIVVRMISLHVSHLCRSYPRDFLETMSKNFERISDRIEWWGSTYSTRYECIDGDRSVKCEMELIRSIEGTVNTMESHVGSLREYVNHELYQPTYFEKHPADAIIRLGESSQIMFFKLGQLLISISPQFHVDLFRGNIRSKISSVNREMMRISKIVSEHEGASGRPEIKRTFAGVGQVCSSIRITLRKLSKQSILDQIIRESNDPRPIKEADDESATMGSCMRTASRGGFQMHLNWTRCQGEFWCKFNNVNLEHEHFDYCRGVYIIWHGGRDPGVVYVGQGDIKARIQNHRSDPAIQRFEPHGLYLTWAVMPESSRDGVESFLAKKWTPKVGTDHPSADPIEVNSPWD